jgi:hypothetical protein
MPPYQGNVEPLTHNLDLRDFFDYYDDGNPYHLSAVGELMDAINKADPSILDSRSDWFHTWTWGGKREHLRSRTDLITSE